MGEIVELLFRGLKHGTGLKPALHEKTLHPEIGAHGCLPSKKDRVVDEVEKRGKPAGNGERDQPGAGNGHEVRAAHE